MPVCAIAAPLVISADEFGVLFFGICASVCVCVSVCAPRVLSADFVLHPCVCVVLLSLPTT